MGYAVRYNGGGNDRFWLVVAAAALFLALCTTIFGVPAW
jgi:hypothetical protein